MKKAAIFITYTVLTTFSPSGTAAELIVPAAKDNTLYEDPAGRFSNGAGQYLFVGRTGTDNGLDMLARRALLMFDLSSIPAGSTVEEVDLSITIDRVPLEPVGDMMRLHKLQNSWGEEGSNAPGAEGQGTSAEVGDATWIHRSFNALQWIAPGGDYAPVASTSVQYSTGPETLIFPTTAMLVVDVQDMVDNPAQNHGWIVIGDESSGMSARRVLSRENTNLGNPTLRVQFEPPEIIDPPLPIPVPVAGVAGYALLILFILLGTIGATRRQETDI